MFCIPLMNKVITVLEIASFACDYVYSVCFPFKCVAAETAFPYCSLFFSVDTGAVN